MEWHLPFSGSCAIWKHLTAQGVKATLFNVCLMHLRIIDIPLHYCLFIIDLDPNPSKEWIKSQEKINKRWLSEYPKNITLQDSMACISWGTSSQPNVSWRSPMQCSVLNYSTFDNLCACFVHLCIFSSWQMALWFIFAYTSGSRYVINKWTLECCV